METINETSVIEKTLAIDPSERSKPLVEAEEIQVEEPQLEAVSELKKPMSLVASMIDRPAALESTGKPAKGSKISFTAKRRSKWSAENVRALQERCRQLGLATFLRDQSPIRSLGFTSSIAGEGKSFLSVVMASLLAKDSPSPVTLLECNWDNPGFHEQFGLVGKPGLAEWLRGESSENEVRHSIDRNLSLIPAGHGRYDAARLVQQMRQRGLLNLFDNPDEIFIVDLPPVVASGYGALAASLVESLVIVLRAGVTTNAMLAETYEQLRHLSIQGVILNQVESRIPNWIRQML